VFPSSDTFNHRSLYRHVSESTHHNVDPIEMPACWQMYTRAYRPNHRELCKTSVPTTCIGQVWDVGVAGETRMSVLGPCISRRSSLLARAACNTLPALLHAAHAFSKQAKSPWLRMAGKLISKCVENQISRRTILCGYEASLERCQRLFKMLEVINSLLARFSKPNVRHS